MSVRLMVPGPVTVEDDVLHEMGSPVQVHYGPEWTAIYKETTGLLQQVFQTQGDVHIMVGSGSAGLDAAVGSMTAPGDTIIIGCNGFFGERIIAIAQDYGLNVVRVDAPFGRPLDPSAFDRALAQHPDAAAVMLIHLETSTTVINPVQDIAAVAHDYEVPIMVDVVSSLGGVPVKMDEWGLDICISASPEMPGRAARTGSGGDQPARLGGDGSQAAARARLVSEPANVALLRGGVGHLAPLPGHDGG